MNRYLLTFTLNWAVECGVVLAVLRRARLRRVLGVELALNLATHPILWYGLLRLPGKYLTNLFLCEAAVFATEAALAVPLYRGCGTRARIVAAVVAANATTFLMTFLV